MKTKTPNQIQFGAALVAAYTELFKTDPLFAYSASKMTPEALAEKMLNSAIASTANTTGPGFRRACKACGIKHTARDIKTFLAPVASHLPDKSFIKKK